MKTVLIADDHYHTHRLVATRLRALGLRVVSATDGDEVLTIARAENPDLILLDVTMPKRDGLSALRELKANEKTRAIPVVMLTAQGDDAEVAEAMQAGALRYLHKPFDPTELGRVVQELLQPD